MHMNTLLAMTAAAAPSSPLELLLAGDTASPLPYMSQHKDAAMRFIHVVRRAIAHWDRGVLSLVFNGSWQETKENAGVYDTYGQNVTWPTFEKDVRLGLV